MSLHLESPKDFSLAHSRTTSGKVRKENSLTMNDSRDGIKIYNKTFNRCGNVQFDKKTSSLDALEPFSANS